MRHMSSTGSPVQVITKFGKSGEPEENVGRDLRAVFTRCFQMILKTMERSSVIPTGVTQKHCCVRQKGQRR